MEDRIAQIRWMSGLNIVLGAWVIISPWVLSYDTTSSRVNSVIFGIALIIFGLIREAVPRTAWSSWINFLVALWLIISPFVLQLNSKAAYWNLVIIGIIAAINSYANASTELNQPR